MQLAHLVVVNGDEPHLTQALALHTIVNNIAEAIELIALGQLFLCFLDGGGHSETETTAGMAVVTPKQKPLPLSISICNIKI